MLDGIAFNEETSVSSSVTYPILLRVNQCSAAVRRGALEQVGSLSYRDNHPLCTMSLTAAYLILPTHISTKGLQDGQSPSSFVSSQDYRKAPDVSIIWTIQHGQLFVCHVPSLHYQKYCHHVAVCLAVRDSDASCINDLSICVVYMASYICCTIPCPVLQQWAAQCSEDEVRVPNERRSGIILDPLDTFMPDEVMTFRKVAHLANVGWDRPCNNKFVNHRSYTHLHRPPYTFELHCMIEVD